MNDLGIGKCGADFRDGAGLVDENAVGRGQRARKRGGKGRGRIKPGRRIEARRTLADVPPALCQPSCLLDDRAARREFEQAEPDRRSLQRTLRRHPLTRLPSRCGEVRVWRISNKRVRVSGDMFFVSAEAGPTRQQLDKPAAQHAAQRRLRRLAALRFAADLHDDPLALVEPPAARDDFALRQKGRPVAADIDQRRTQRRQQAPHAAEMDAAGLETLPALDPDLDGDAVFNERRPPFAGDGGDYQLAGHRGR